MILNVNFLVFFCSHVIQVVDVVLW